MTTNVCFHILRHVTLRSAARRTTRPRRVGCRKQDAAIKLTCLCMCICTCKRQSSRLSFTRTNAFYKCLNSQSKQRLVKRGLALTESLKRVNLLLRLIVDKRFSTLMICTLCLILKP